MHTTDIFILNTATIHSILARLCKYITQVVLKVSTVIRVYHVKQLISNLFTYADTNVMQFLDLHYKLEAKTSSSSQITYYEGLG